MLSWTWTASHGPIGKVTNRLIRYDNGMAQASLEASSQWAILLYIIQAPMYNFFFFGISGF
jgi:hypothetical protein